MKGPLRQIAELIITNLEQMSLPKTQHWERENMISEVHHMLTNMLTERGFVRVTKPDEES